MHKMAFLIVLLLAILVLPVAAEVPSVRIENITNVTLTPIEYDPYPAQPNQVVHLWIKVQNVGEATLEDATFKLIPEYPFSLPDGYSGILREGDLKAGESRILEYDIKVAKDAVEGYYDLTVGACADTDCKNYQKITFQLFVNTGGEAKVEVLVESFDSLVGGTTGDITLSIVNRGQLGAKFLVVEIGKSDEVKILNPSRIYIGELDSDDFETVDLNIYANPSITTTKDIMLPIKLEFSDINDKSYTLNQEVSFPVYSKEDVNKYNAPTSGNMSKLLVIAFFALVVIAYFIWKKKKKT